MNTHAEQHKYHGEMLLEHLRMTYLLKHFNARHMWALFVLINGLITTAILSFLAYLTGDYFIFPSVGPTAILFFMSPQAESVRPRNVLIGHAIGIICGYLALVVTGLTNTASIVDGGITLHRVIAASLALSFTGALMVVFKTPHAPAGATTLIIALGFITHPFDLCVIELAVFLLVLQAIGINRLAGVSGKPQQQFNR